MLKLRVRELAQERGFNISQLQLHTGVAMGTMRRYWYGTRDGKVDGDALHEVDLRILAAIAAALHVGLAELVEEVERLARLLAGCQPSTNSRAWSASG